MTDYLKLYHESIENEEKKDEENLIESLEQLDEAILLTAIAAALASGVLFRIIDAVKGNKPTLTQYIKGILRWAFSEYSNGTLSINEIRRTAYAVMKEDKEMEEEFGPSFSKILSKKLLKGLRGGVKEFAKLVGYVIGLIAKKANMSEADIEKIIKVLNTEIA